MENPIPSNPSDSPSEIQRYLNSLRKPIKNSQLRRASWHDYRSRCFYMITLFKNPTVPIFSTLSEKTATDRTVSTVLSTIGTAIRDALSNFSAKHPFFEISTSVIMPDHVHLIIFVKEPLPKNLGYYIAMLKGECSTSYWKSSAITENKIPVFSKGFNDRILTKQNQLATWKTYIHDNPRRLLLRLRFPNLFQRATIITIDNSLFSTYGNLFLLKHPCKHAVKVSRSFSDREKDENRKKWLNAACDNEVLVSPFFHPEEKQIRQKAIELGANIIQIVEHPFAPREKPAKSDFELCAQGRLLFIFISLRQEPALTLTNLTKVLASRLNNLASYIATLSSSQFSIKKPS